MLISLKATPRVRYEGVTTDTTRVLQVGAGLVHRSNQFTGWYSLASGYGCSKQEKRRIYLVGEGEDVQGHTTGKDWNVYVAALSPHPGGGDIVPAGDRDSGPKGSATWCYLCCLWKQILIVDVDTWLTHAGEAGNASGSIPDFTG